MLTPSSLQINRRLDEERTRAQAYLAPSTEPLLIALLERTLISAHLASILDHPASGLSTLIQDSRLEDLRLLYGLFGRVSGGHTALQTAVSKWIIEIGGKVNDGLLVVLERGDDEDAVATDPKGKGKAREDDVDMKPEIHKKRPEAPGNAKTKAALAWVQNVLDLKEKFDTILSKAFASDKAFEKSINDVSRWSTSDWADADPRRSSSCRPSPSSLTKTQGHPNTSHSSLTRTSRRASKACVPVPA